jgi:ankyrin repeat protein
LRVELMALVGSPELAAQDIAQLRTHIEQSVKQALQALLQKKVVNVLQDSPQQCVRSHSLTDSALLDGISDGSLSAVHRALQEGANVNAQFTQDHVSMCGVIRAALDGQVDIVKLLIQKGATISSATVAEICSCNLLKASEVLEAEQTIHRIISDYQEPWKTLGQLPVCQYPDLIGITVLHLVCWSGMNEMAELLLATGANANSVDAAGRTPLHMCCCNMNVDRCTVIQLLFKATAPCDPDREDANKLTALDYLVQRIEIAAPDGAANREGQISDELVLQMVQILVENGCNVNHVGPDGMTALHHAVHSNNLALVQILLQCNQIDLDKRTDIKSNLLEIVVSIDDQRVMLTEFCKHLNKVRLRQLQSAAALQMLQLALIEAIKHSTMWSFDLILTHCSTYGELLLCGIQALHTACFGMADLGDDRFSQRRNTVVKTLLGANAAVDELDAQQVNNLLVHRGAIT